MIHILTLADVAKLIGCSKATVSRAAHTAKVGFVAGNRLMGFTKDDIVKIKPYVHETAGNPDWIALKRKRRS
jgi:hypothetical protein